MGDDDDYDYVDYDASVKGKTIMAVDHVVVVVMMTMLLVVVGRMTTLMIFLT